MTRIAQTASRRKAFISAPLIGTVIFLSAVIFVVNLQNIEAQASLRVANDAYHNRISSVLEVHRSDLASIFREGLSRTISYYLLTPGWDVFVWNNNPSSTYYPPEVASDHGISENKNVDGSLDDRPDGRISLAELKYAKCETVRALTSDVICSIPETGGISGQAEYKYGLPQWMSKFVNPVVFEGITFNTSNLDQVKVFLPEDGPNQAQVLQDYQNYCNALLRGSVFDCRAFAERDALSCVDHDVNGNGRLDEGPEDIKPLDGCEDGRFFVKVNVENPVRGFEVYPKLPRVEASDTGGNVFRSSGIGEENFYLPINLRIFKYFQDTLGVYEHLAYGPGGDINRNEGISEGVADGYCGETDPSRCVNEDPGFKDAGYNLAGVDPGNTDAIKNKVANDFFYSVFKRACAQPPTQNTELFFCDDSDCSSVSKCDTLQFTSFSSTTGPFANQFCGTSGGAGACAYYPSVKFDFKLVDNDAAFRIDPRNPIAFKWGTDIKHDLPSS